MDQSAHFPLELMHSEPRRFGRGCTMASPSNVTYRSRQLKRSCSDKSRRSEREACQRMLTARAANSTSTVSEMIDCSIMRAFPHRANAGVSVGENAVLVLKARNK